MNTLASQREIKSCMKDDKSELFIHYNYVVFGKFHSEIKIDLSKKEVRVKEFRAIINTNV